MECERNLRRAHHTRILIGVISFLLILGGSSQWAKAELDKSFIQALPTSQNIYLGNSVIVKGLLYYVEKSDVWRIGDFDNSSTEFDTNVRDDPETVIFTLDEPVFTFPDGLGTDIGPQRSRIVINFDLDSKVEQVELGIKWNPGGSEGVEQFLVFLNGSNLGSSKIIRGSDQPYEWQMDVFNSSELGAGKYNLTLIHVQGDGLYFDALNLCAYERKGISDVQVNLECIAPNETTFTRSIQTTANGSYVAVLKPDSPGIWQIKASWEGNGDYLSAESTYVSLEVTRQYRLSITSDYGNVNGEGLYDEGSSATASVDRKDVPAEDLFHVYVFVGWGGDASGTSQTSNPILMDGPKTAIAIWEKQLSTTAYAIVGGIVILVVCLLLFIQRRKR